MKISINKASSVVPRLPLSLPGQPYCTEEPEIARIRTQLRLATSKHNGPQKVIDDDNYWKKRSNIVFIQQKQQRSNQQWYAARPR